MRFRVAEMLRQMLTAFVTMLLYYSSSTPYWSAVPPRTGASPPVRLASSRPARRAYLGRGLTGRVECPADDDPPHRLIIWSRRGRVIQSSDDVNSSALGRVSVDVGGILVIDSVRPSDAGDYRCTLYSPHDAAGRLSFVIKVVVKGKYLNIY